MEIFIISLGIACGCAVGYGWCLYHDYKFWNPTKSFKDYEGNA